MKKKVLSLLLIASLALPIFPGLTKNVKAGTMYNVLLYTGQSSTVTLQAKTRHLGYATNSSHYLKDGSVHTNAKCNDKCKGSGKKTGDYATGTLSSNKLKLQATKAGGTSYFYVYKDGTKVGDNLYSSAYAVTVKNKLTSLSATATAPNESGSTVNLCTATTAYSPTIYTYVGKKITFTANTNTIDNVSYAWNLSYSSSKPNTRAITFTPSNTGTFTISVTTTQAKSSAETVATSLTTRTFNVVVYKKPSITWNSYNGSALPSNATLAMSLADGIVHERDINRVVTYDPLSYEKASVELKSSDTQKLKVSDNGDGSFTLVPLSETNGGTLTLTYTLTLSGGRCGNVFGNYKYSGQFNVTISKSLIHYITEIYFQDEEIKIPLGETRRIVPKYYPSDAVIVSFIYESSDKLIATVNQSNGLVSPIKVGSTTITASAMTNENIKGSYKLYVINPAPTISSISSVYNGIYLKWNQVPNTSSYEIYRSTSLNGEYEAIKRVDATSYIDTEVDYNKTYYYKIIAKSEEGGSYDSNFSNIKYIKRSLPTPTITSITKGSRYYEMKINGSGDGFVIYNCSNGKENLLTSTTSNSAVLSLDVGSYAIKVKGYILVNGARVYSTLSAPYTLVVNKSTLEGNYGSPVPMSQSALKPTSVKVTKVKKNSFKVSWKKPKNGASGYQIKYSTSKSFKASKSKIATTTKRSRTIKKLKKGKAYYVKIRSYKKYNGNIIFSKYTTRKKVKLKKK